MPFFWKTLVPAGVVLGNQAKGSKVTVQNDQWFSYPGYSEMLTGRPQPDVKSNDFVRYPHRTVLEHAREALGLEHSGGRADRLLGRLQVRGLEPRRRLLHERRPRCRARSALDARDRPVRGPAPAGPAALGREQQRRADLPDRARVTCRKNQPRVMWIGLGQSDDWAHARRYDLVLDYLHIADRLLADLWQTLQSMEPYRGRTTLIVTTDHGRGRTPADWAEHDAGIQGSPGHLDRDHRPGHACDRRGRQRPGRHAGYRRRHDAAAPRARLAEVQPRRGPPVPGRLQRAPDRALPGPNCDPASCAAADS